MVFEEFIFKKITQTKKNSENPSDGVGVKKIFEIAATYFSYPLGNFICQLQLPHVIANQLLK